MQGQSGFRLPLNADLVLDRPRWSGPLSAAEIAAARANGLALAWCPAQGGLVLASARDAGDDPVLPVWARQVPVRLRPWSGDDIAACHALMDDPGLWQFLPEAMPQPLTPDTVADLIAIAGAAHHLVRCIDTAQGPAGQVRLLWQGAGLAPDEAELSYWLGRAHRGRGLALAAVQQALALAWGLRPDLRRIVAYTHPDNAPSARLLARAGFAPTGTRAADGWNAHMLSRAAAATHRHS
ncbi:MAG: GNAT family N-acetyltransferase [Gemmobacter sp.]|uniref:GNAT family N-acetyltransferase n=1 Tax=Gemmobacter sp. TaxID=1898957 RepID=UPI00391C88CD